MLKIMENFKNDYFNDSGKKYENHVNKYIEYLRMIDKLDTPTKITLDDIDNCIGHYSNIGKINYRASMESHLESIKSFYDYLSDTGKAADIFTQINYEKFKNDIFGKYNLSEGVEREIFSMQTIMEILSTLDDALELEFTNLKGKRNRDRYAQRIVLRLFIKLTLIAPAKKSNICNLKFKDFSADFRTFTINNSVIKLPNSLRNNILEAIEFTKNMGKKEPNENEKLLHHVFIGNFSNMSLNAWFCTFLKENNILDINDSKTSYELEPIMKTAIKSMVDRMVNPAVISKISGIKIATLENTYYSDIKELVYKKTMDQAINWEIAKNEYYNYI